MATTKKVSEAHAKHKAVIDEKSKSSTQVQEGVIKRATVQKASLKTAEIVAKDITSLKLSTAEMLDSIANLTAERIQELKTVEDAIGIQAENLQSLYEVTAAAGSLEALLAAIDEQKAASKEEQARTRALWDEERGANAKANRLAEEETNRTRLRENAEYQYNRDEQRRREEDQWKRQREDSERDLGLREAAVRLAEIEIAMLREQVAGFPAKLEQEAAKAVAAGISALEKEHAHRAEVERLKTDAEIAALGQRNVALQERLVDTALERDNLVDRLKDATQKVQSIAEKAIEGASRQAVNLNMPAGDGRK